MCSHEYPDKGSIKKDLYKAKILLMDDDEIIRTAIQGLLETLGYYVETCSDGTEAVGLYKKASEEQVPFDVVVLDLTVPHGLNGADTMKQLVAYDPNVKGVVSSGYADDAIFQRYKEYGFCDLVQKPYKIEKLDQVIHRVINHHSS